MGRERGYQVMQFGLADWLVEEGLRTKRIRLFDTVNVVDLAEDNFECGGKGETVLKVIENFEAGHAGESNVQQQDRRHGRTNGRECLGPSQKAQGFDSVAQAANGIGNSEALQRVLNECRILIGI
jgi:hypothetical protein